MFASPLPKLGQRRRGLAEGAQKPEADREPDDRHEMRPALHDGDGEGGPAVVAQEDPHVALGDLVAHGDERFAFWSEFGPEGRAVRGAPTPEPSDFHLRP